MSERRLLHASPELQLAILRAFAALSVQEEFGELLQRRGLAVLDDGTYSGEALLPEPLRVRVEQALRHILQNSSREDIYQSAWFAADDFMRRGGPGVFVFQRVKE